MNTGKIIFWSLTGLVVIGGGYLIYKNFFGKNNADGDSNAAGSLNTSLIIFNVSKTMKGGEKVLSYGQSCGNGKYFNGNACVDAKYINWDKVKNAA